jgi:hypothetical protein
MKSVRLLQIFSVIMFLSLMMLVMPVVPVKAAGEISLSPQAGATGTTITIKGTGFNKSTFSLDKYAAIYFSSDEASTLDDIGEEVTHYKLVNESVWLDEEGQLETTFEVPDILADSSKDEIVDSGTYYVYVCHYIGTTIQSRIIAVAEFTVTMGEIALSPLQGAVDTMVEIIGDDFPSNEEIMVRYDGSDIPITTGDRQTSSTGSFSSFIRIPDSISGSHTVVAIVSGVEGNATFSIEPEIFINPIEGKAGATVLVSGTGFGQLKTVKVWFDNAKVATITTNTWGSFHVDFTVPDRQAGIYNINAEEGANVAKTKYTITAPPPLPTPEPPPTPEPSASISISATIGTIGQEIIIDGSSFESDSIVVLKYDDEPITSVTTDNDGFFTAAFTVPSSKHGNHSVTASDGTNILKVNFAVESTPPPVPLLLLPQMGDKVTSPIHFNWQAVIDNSPPVTYTLQIATSPEFSSNSMALERMELTTTEYSVTGEESLRLGIIETPYYWRVRAIDGALNEGNWSNAGTFYVVSSGIPTWAIITMPIIIAILLIAMGLYIGIKISSSRKDKGSVISSNLKRSKKKANKQLTKGTKQDKTKKRHTHKL